MNLHRSLDAVEAAQACATHILLTLQRAISLRGTATLAISGGSSPRMMFEIFARTAFPWDRVHLFWVDERVVPPTDPQSNFKLASDAWLQPAQFPAANIHRVEAELGAEPAARLYRAAIRGYFGLDGASTEHPRFDVIHRGMGPDGHTASLFPGDPIVENRDGVAAAVWVEKMHQWRVTLLRGTLEAARNTAMLVTGRDKTDTLKTVLEGEFDPGHYPAQIASLGESGDWFVDREASETLAGL